MSLNKRDPVFSHFEGAERSFSAPYNIQQITRNHKEANKLNCIKTQFFPFIKMQGQQMDIKVKADRLEEFNPENEYNLKTSRVENVKLNLSLSNIYRRYRSMAVMKGLEFRYDITLDDQDSEILTDGRMLNIVISGLIRIALMVTESGYISFGYMKKGNFLEFYVSDTGQGMNEEETKIIYSENAIPLNIKLKSINNISSLREYRISLKALGGNMRVESDPLEGSVFYFTLPYKKA
jgi:K+-sensing histidine kinase KdpD